MLYNFPSRAGAFVFPFYKSVQLRQINSTQQAYIYIYIYIHIYIYILSFRNSFRIVGFKKPPDNRLQEGVRKVPGKKK